MKHFSLLLPLILQFFCLNIHSKEVSSKISGDTTFITSIDTTIMVELPILKVNCNLFLDEVVSTVLNYKIHELENYKDCIYVVETQKDSLGRGVVVYVGLKPSIVLESSQMRGIFRMKKNSFVCFGDNPDSLYSYTNDKQELTYTKTLGYKENGFFIRSLVPEIIESPMWKFVYGYENKKLELYRVEFLPFEEY